MGFRHSPGSKMQPRLKSCVLTEIKARIGSFTLCDIICDVSCGILRLTLTLLICNNVNLQSWGFGSMICVCCRLPRHVIYMEANNFKVAHVASWHVSIDLINIICQIIPQQCMTLSCRILVMVCYVNQTYSSNRILTVSNWFFFKMPLKLLGSATCQHKLLAVCMMWPIFILTTGER